MRDPQAIVSARAVSSRPRGVRGGEAVQACSWWCLRGENFGPRSVRTTNVISDRRHTRRHRDRLSFTRLDGPPPAPQLVGTLRPVTAVEGRRGSGEDPRDELLIVVGDVVPGFTSSVDGRPTPPARGDFSRTIRDFSPPPSGVRPPSNGQGRPTWLPHSAIEVRLRQSCRTGEAPGLGFTHGHRVAAPSRHRRPIRPRCTEKRMWDVAPHHRDM